MEPRRDHVHDDQLLGERVVPEVLEPRRDRGRRRRVIALGKEQARERDVQSPALACVGAGQGLLEPRDAPRVARGAFGEGELGEYAALLVGARRFGERAAQELGGVIAAIGLGRGPSCGAERLDGARVTRRRRVQQVGAIRSGAAPEAASASATRRCIAARAKGAIRAATAAPISGW